MPLGVEKTSCMFLDFFTAVSMNFLRMLNYAWLEIFLHLFPQTDLHNTQMLFMALEL